jgi:hypothetical protein
MKRWSFEQDAAGRSVIRHNALPRFCAYWTSGTAKEAIPLDEPCWHEAGSSEDDCLLLFGFQWIDSRPDSLAFDRLMQDAAKVIDAWIVGRL